jgi:hypothetical protein
MDKVREFRDGESGMVWDASFQPVIIRTYYGCTTDKLVRDTIAWLSEYLTNSPRRAKTILISDTSAVAATDSKGRRVAAEMTKALQPSMRAHNVEVVVILGNPVQRAAIKAIGWVTEVNLAPARDLQDALRVASESLAKVGETLPLGLTARYRAPSKR